MSRKYHIAWQLKRHDIIVNRTCEDWISKDLSIEDATKLFSLIKELVENFEVEN